MLARRRASIAACTNTWCRTPRCRRSLGSTRSRLKGDDRSRSEGVRGGGGSSSECRHRRGRLARSRAQRRINHERHGCGRLRGRVSILVPSCCYEDAMPSAGAQPQSLRRMRPASRLALPCGRARRFRGEGESVRCPASRPASRARPVVPRTSVPILSLSQKPVADTFRYDARLFAPGHSAAQNVRFLSGIKRY